MERLSADYTRPGIEAWWERNPLAMGVYCPTCGTNLRDSYDAVRECPFGCEVAA